MVGLAKVEPFPSDVERVGVHIACPALFSGEVPLVLYEAGTKTGGVEIAITILRPTKLISKNLAALYYLNRASALVSVRSVRAA